MPRKGQLTIQILVHSNIFENTNITEDIKSN